MNFDFTEEQQMVRDSIARFVQDDYDWDTRKAIVASDEGMNRDNWRLFAELGWLSIPFAEEHGGFGGNIVNLSVVMEELGKGCGRAVFSDRCLVWWSHQARGHRGSAG